MNIIINNKVINFKEGGMISLKKKEGNQKGFTIVELLIVIVVIGILAAIAFVAYGSVTKKARDSERLSDVKAISSKMEEYYATNASYPYTGGTVTANGYTSPALVATDNTAVQTALCAPATTATPTTLAQALATSFVGLNVDSTKAPGGAGCSIIVTFGAAPAATAATKNNYNLGITGPNSFTITYWDEATGTSKTISSSNN